MDLLCRWETLLISMWIQVGFVSGQHVKDGTVNHLSADDIFLLKDDPNPKCFTRRAQDFTCFFETADNRTYDFYYTIPESGKTMCEISVKRTENGPFLHICAFPDIYLFTDIYLEVMERDTNISLYNRNVYVEENFLLKPPFNVSLHQNGHAGQLLVSWLTEDIEDWEHGLQYEIRYSSKGLGEKKIQAKNGDVLNSLVPGEEVEVQVKVRYSSSGNAGRWSSWSQPARALVPRDPGVLVLLWVPLSLLMTAILLFIFFSMYFSKLKLYLWPPVPNLEKVLQGLLTDISEQQWNPPITPKQGPEETTSSVVEVMSKDEVSGLHEPSVDSGLLLTSEQSFSSTDQEDGGPETDVFPDYVSLNKDSIILCPKGNNYVYKQVGEKEAPVLMDDRLQMCHSSCIAGSVCTAPCLCTDFLNHSYLAPAKPADGFEFKDTATRGPGNIYTHFPCS